MSFSKRKLYSAGEPLGDAVTKRKLCGGLVCGGGGSSSSSSTSNPITDKRMVTDSGSGVSIDASGKSSVSSSVQTIYNNNIQSVDAKIVNKALEVVQEADAVQGEGFEQLLSTASSGLEQLLGFAEKIFDGGQAALKTSTESNLAGLSAITTAANDKTGQVDQKTILILGACGVAAAWAFGRGGK